MKNLDIVIATFNGEKYIAEQLDSILSSDDIDTIVNEIIISDDNSSDKTRDIISNYAKNYPFIKLYINSGKSGVVGNFSNALNISTADYIVLCDQDDFWKSEKLSILTNGIKKLENNSIGNKPCLFFTDLEVVDENLNVIDDSFFHLTKNEPKRFFKDNSVLLMNIVPGCSMVINNTLKKIALPVCDSSIYIHDWWLLLIAHFTGNIGFSNESTFLYRQHDKNTIGVTKRGLYIKIKNSIEDLRIRNDLFTITSDVHSRLVLHGFVKEGYMLNDLLHLQNKSRISKLVFMYKNKIKFSSAARFNAFYRNARLILNMLLRKSN